MTEPVPDFFEEAKRYIGWSDADADRLAAVEPVLRPYLAGFADHFYEVIQRHPRAMAVITGGPAQLERLGRSLVDWMVTGLIGPHDHSFHAARSRIGRRHVVIGLPQEYMFTAMNVLRLDYHARLVEVVRDDSVHAAIASVDKLFDLELAIMLHHYQQFATEQRVEAERRAQQDRLVAMQTLTSGLAHEIRNPLNAATLQLELLQRRLRRIAEPDPLLETTGRISQEIERLGRLLDDFLAFARPAPLATEAHDLARIVREVVAGEHAAAAARGVAIVVSGDDAPVTAELDAGKVHQVVVQLVRNAIEAASPGGRVELELATIPDGAQLRITDDGPGIPDAVRTRIFEPFFSTKPDGTGMGLAIVHSLVLAHGGTIDLASPNGRGISFTITLPRR